MFEKFATAIQAHNVVSTSGAKSEKPKCMILKYQVLLYLLLNTDFIPPDYKTVVYIPILLQLFESNAWI